MKLVRYGEPGRERPGVVDASGGIRDISSIVSDLAGEGLSRASLRRILDSDATKFPRVEGVRLGPPVGNVRHFIAVGLNYADHAAEAGAAIPSEPILFNKAPSCIVGPNDGIVIPRGSFKTDWEVELAVVIGEAASYVSEQDAPGIIAGYTVCHDVSERSFQLDRGGQWMKGKGCPTFGPLGPWLVTPDEAGDVQDLSMWLEVNGERMQTGSTSKMIFSVPFLVSYISTYMRLEAGDVITTGTPPGVGMGRKPPRYLRPGDRVSLGIDRLGSQSQSVTAD
ncbi:MAG: fumarylacetoacetate hydrolase family protein [Phycisphaerae bacterium]|nr:fumarylacetoacetate hydrolase family protein [Phycisphaerae bacterium]